MKFTVYIATSIDGFIAKENGDIDWLMDADYTIDVEDYGFADFFKSISCLVMGANTFKKVLSFPEWPYEGKRVVVYSNSISEIPTHLKGKVDLFSGSLTQLIDKLADEGETNLYIDGGKLIQSFVYAGYIDTLILTTIPVLLGKGIPLFGPLKSDLKLQHISTKTFESGLVQTEYQKK